MSNVKEVREKVNNLPWLDPKYDLPEDKEYVFCACKSPIVGFIFHLMTFYGNKRSMYKYDWDGAGFYDFDSEYGYTKWDNVIAWLPLPKFGKDDSNG